MVAQPLGSPGHAAAAAPDPLGVAGCFAQELADLAHIGRALAGSHPELARHLGREAADPDIERLLEGTAFLCAQIRARNDACAPELTGDLADLIAPWLTRALPAAAIVGFAPELRQAPARQLLPAHTPLQAGAKACGFRTTTPIALHPIVAQTPTWQAAAGGGATLRVPCALGPQATWAALAEDGLTFYLDGDYPEASSLHLALTHHLLRAQILVGKQRRPIFVRLAPAACSQVPLTPHFGDEAPIPLGIGLLRDHMVLPQKFLFVQLTLPLGAVEGSLGDSLTVELHLDGAAQLAPGWHDVAWRMHCVPAVNVVAQDAVPLRHTWAQTRHVLRPQPQGSQDPGHVLAVQEVLAASPDQGALRLSPWHQRDRHDPWVYALEPEAGPLSPARLRLFAAPDSPPHLAPQTLSVRLWCHGGAAAGGLAPGRLTACGQALGRTRVTNLTATTQPRPAPPSHDLRFALLGLVQQRGRPAADAAALRRHLALIAIDGHIGNHEGRAQALRAQSILDVACSTAARAWGGAPVLCAQLTITLANSGFASMGDAYLFVSCIDALWADSQPIHGLICTTLVLPDAGCSYGLPLRCGDAQRGPGAYLPLPEASGPQ